MALLDRLNDTVGLVATMARSGMIAPLRPDTDVVSDVHVLETRTSKSRPDVGIVKFKFELREASGKTLMTQLITTMFRRRVQD